MPIPTAIMGSQIFDLKFKLHILTEMRRSGYGLQGAGLDFFVRSNSCSTLLTYNLHT